MLWVNSPGRSPDNPAPDKMKRTLHRHAWVLFCCRSIMLRVGVPGWLFDEPDADAADQLLDLAQFFFVLSQVEVFLFGFVECYPLAQHGDSGSSHLSHHLQNFPGIGHVSFFQGRLSGGGILRDSARALTAFARRCETASPPRPMPIATSSSNP